MVPQRTGLPSIMIMVETVLAARTKAPPIVPNESLTVSNRACENQKMFTRWPRLVFLATEPQLKSSSIVSEHTAGRLKFEFVSWSQGLIRNNLLRSDWKTNRFSSPERLRLMFVAGMIAEVEASLRPTTSTIAPRYPNHSEAASITDSEFDRS